MSQTTQGISLPQRVTTRSNPARLNRNEARMAYLFITPAMVLFLVFVLLPAVIAFILSFSNYDVLSAIKWVGWANYERLLKDKLYFQALGNVVSYALMYVPLMIMLSLGLSLALNRKMPGMRFFRAIYYVPVITSPVAAATIWSWLLSRNGLLNQSLGLFGLPSVAWLSNTDTAMLAIVVVTLWQGLGSNMIVYLAGLQGVPEYLYEAAVLDGANRWQLFRFITWPALRTTTFFVSTLSLIGAFQLFDQAYVLFQQGGGPGNTARTVVFTIYQNGFTQLKMGYAASQAFFLFILIFIVTVINLRINREQNITT